MTQTSCPLLTRVYYNVHMGCHNIFQLLDYVPLFFLSLFFVPLFDFLSLRDRGREWEKSCLVGVCCPSARAKIDSKLQSLLRTPHCVAWPQNNTHRHTLAGLRTIIEYTVCCPISIFPIQPVEVTIRQTTSVPTESPALKWCASKVNWLWITDVIAIAVPSQLTKTHTPSFYMCMFSSLSHGINVYG